MGASGSIAAKGRGIAWWVALVLCVAAVIHSGVTLWSFPRWTVDDAFIVARYAKHLVEHGQLTWNVAGDRVEGYTGIALPLVVALGMRLGLAPLALTRFLGAACLYAAAWTVMDNQRRLGVPQPIRAYVACTPLVFPALYVHATSGLETMPFVALLGASFGALLACVEAPRPSRQLVLWLELLALSLVRPEGVLFAAVFGCALAVVVRGRAGARGWSAAAIAACAFALPYGAYFVWRATYYGRLLPNTYYAKLAATGFDGGFLQAAGALSLLLMPLLVAGVVVTVLNPHRPRSTRLPRTPTMAAAVGLGLLAVQYSRSALIMGYQFRFQVHCLFLLLPFLGVLLAGAVNWRELLRRYGAATGSAVTGLVGVCLVGWPIEAIAMESSVKAQARRYLEVESEQHALAGAWLRDHLPASESIACWVDAGLIPLIADDHVALDFGRLNDRYLARPGISRREVADYFFSQRPGALVVTADGPHQEHPQHDGATVTGDPRFDAYERVRTFCSPEYPDAPCEVVYLRRGLDVP